MQGIIADCYSLDRTCTYLDSNGVSLAIVFVYISLGGTIHFACGDQPSKGLSILGYLAGTAVYQSPLLICLQSCLYTVVCSPQVIWPIFTAKKIARLCVHCGLWTTGFKRFSSLRNPEHYEIGIQKLGESLVLQPSMLCIKRVPQSTESTTKEGHPSS